MLSASGFIATSSTGICQHNQSALIQASVENNSRQATNVAAGQTPASYLPASPWSRQVSYEQAAAPGVEPLGPSRVLKQPVRNSSAIKESPKPAGLKWGRIREIQTQEAHSEVMRESTELVDLADVPQNEVASEKANQQETKTLEIGSPMGREPLQVESSKSSPKSWPKESLPVAAEDSESEGIFLLPDGPEERRSDSRSVGQFASSREPMTRTKPVVVPVAPEEVPVSMVSSPSLQEAERMRIAQMQSHELQSIPLGPAYGEPRLLESPVGWKAVRQELAKHLETCDSLLKRGATHSARAEILVGLRKLFRTMDLHRGVTHSETCFEAALIAMREEADLHNLKMSRSVASIVAMHQTPALKNRPLDSVTTELACQHYRAYARYQLTQAADGHIYAADLLYALGKTLEKDADLNSDRAQQLRSQAVICYQTSLQLRPSQHHASNQLGYALIHLDRIEEAYDALRSSIETKPNAPAWTNLAEIYRRRGAATEASYAVQQAMALGAERGEDKLDVTQVDPTVFAQFSPALNANTSTMPQPTSAVQTAQGQPPAHTAKANNFFTKMFR
jgi:tetratricopeptide (TPR) repeat protein